MLVVDAKDRVHRVYLPGRFRPQYFLTRTGVA
jgi:hypothetical protein